MNNCYTAMLFELQKDENKKKEEEERQRQISEQRKQDLLKGNPFKLSYMDRVNVKKLPGITSWFTSTSSQPTFARSATTALNFKGIRHDRPFINHASPPRQSTKTPKHLILLNKPINEDDGLGNHQAINIQTMYIDDERNPVDDDDHGDDFDKDLPDIDSNKEMEDKKHAVH